MSRCRRIVGVATALALGLLLTGCATQILAQRIVRAPNQQGARNLWDALPWNAVMGGVYNQHWHVPVGPPRAELSVAVLEPGDYKFKAEFTGKPGETMNLTFNFDSVHARAHATAPRGTLVVLHGILMSKDAMLVWGGAFAQRGYRVVLVDLRGHGKSTGDWITFGATEAADLVQVADELARRGLLAGRLGVFGISYGAAVGLQWAARDPRVATVVAVAPYAEPRQAIVDFARGFDAEAAGRLSAATFAAAEAKAAKRAGFAWDDVDVRAAARRLHGPVLFFHGDRDTWIPPRNSEELLALAPAGSRLERLPDDDHITIAMRFDPVAKQAAAWFDEQVATAARVVAAKQD